MKKIVLTALALFLVAGGIAMAQNECDGLYIKAMQANTPAERAQLLKEFLAKCSGKGSQYENFANAFLCTTVYQKTDQETIAYGEKALALGELDDQVKSQVLTALAVVYNKQGQNPEKTKAYANQLIQTATSMKAKEPENANWNNLIGIGHFIIGQTQDRAKDHKGALDSYQTSYAILKDAKILAEMKKIAKAEYEAKAYADAEKVFRFLAQTNPKDVESQRLVGECLYKTGKTQEALAIFKEIHAKHRSGEMAYNIGIILAREAKTNPVLIQDAIRFLLDAALLYPAQSKKAMELAENLYYSNDKEWNNRVKLMQESKQLIDEWAKTINTKFGDKSEEDLTPDQRREYRKIKELIDKEQKVLEDLQAKQKASMEGFNKLLEEAKQRLGIKK